MGSNSELWNQTRDLGFDTIQIKYPTTYKYKHSAVHSEAVDDGEAKEFRVCYAIGRKKNKCVCVFSFKPMCACICAPPDLCVCVCGFNDMRPEVSKSSAVEINSAGLCPSLTAALDLNSADRQSGFVYAEKQSVNHIAALCVGGLQLGKGENLPVLRIFFCSLCQDKGVKARLSLNDEVCV